MHNPKSALETETHKILRDFEIQMDHLLLTKQTDIVIVNKKQRTCRKVDFADHKAKTEGRRKER